MRVLLGLDGSASSRTALALVGSLGWPRGAVIRAVHALPSPPAFADVPTAAVRRDTNAEEDLAASVAGLRRTDLEVETAVVRGEAPAEMLVHEARRWAADLIVLGHRPHGAMATAFLGSVARDVAEHAHCPVLVARGATCDRLVLAEDGSDPAYQARRALATWPMFRGKEVRVVSVAHVLQPLLAGLAATIGAEARAAREEAQTEARVAYGRLATEAAEELRVAGLHATATTRSGDPAEQIVAAARECGADLIVMGTRGRGAVTRVLLGSVARAVLISSPCSVLVVREQ